MNRDAFEHVIRAAAAIVDDEIVVIGSQAILARYPSAPDSLLRSQELDVYPRNDPECAIEIDGALGDGSCENVRAARGSSHVWRPVSREVGSAAAVAH